MRESLPYKEDLVGFAKSFRRRRTFQRWADQSLSKAEKMLFVGCFFMRKLMECNKVTDECARSTATILRAAVRRTREISAFARDDLIDDLDAVEWERGTVDVHQVCDKVIHSWWIMPMHERKGLGGFVMTTDRQKNKELWLVPTQTIVAMFERFGRNTVSRIHAKRDAGGRLTHWQAT